MVSIMYMLSTMLKGLTTYIADPNYLDKHLIFDLVAELRLRSRLQVLRAQLQDALSQSLLAEVLEPKPASLSCFYCPLEFRSHFA